MMPSPYATLMPLRLMPPRLHALPAFFAYAIRALRDIYMRFRLPPLP